MGDRGIEGYNDHVSEVLERVQSGDRLREGVAVLLAAVAIAAAVVLLHGPAVELVLTGDSYQWIQHAHAAGHQPKLLLADLDTFLRPSTTWTLVFDRVVWGGFEARGFRISSLMIHGLVALALFLAGRRLGLGSLAAAAVALVWLSSPFADESAFVVAYRFQPLLLLSWLLLIILWPRSGERWDRRRAIAATIAVIAAAAAKETWVVTPALVAALELDRRRTLREALRPTVLVAIAVAIYVVVYFLSFPAGSKSYFVVGSHVVAKIPTQLAAFLYLKEPLPFALELSWQGVVALIAVAAAAGVCLRWRVAGTWTALALFLLPTLPTLLVPYMPQRYLAIPYAGFLLLTALFLGAAVERLPRWRWAIRGGASVVVILVVIAGGAIVRADLDDYRRMAAAHEVLLAEAPAVSEVVASGDPVVVVRDERAQPLLEILRDPDGFAKLPYTRHADPYGLIDAAALFEWVIADEGTRVEPVAGLRTGAGGRVLIHSDGGFIDPGPVADLATEAERWRADGRRVRVIQAVPLG